MKEKIIIDFKLKKIDEKYLRNNVLCSNIDCMNVITFIFDEIIGIDKLIYCSHECAEKASHSCSKCGREF